jgi:hypothetical protein
MSEGHQLAVGGQALERLALEENVVVADSVDNRRFEHEEPAVHPGAVTHGLLAKSTHTRGHDPTNRLVVIDLE